MGRKSREKKERRGTQLAEDDGTPEAGDGDRPLWKVGLGYLLGAGLGLMVLLIAQYMLSKAPKQTRILELPQVAIMAEFQDFEHPQTRKDLIRLHKALVNDAKLGVIGPYNYPVLVPLGLEKLPEPKNIDQLTREEVQAAKPYFTVSKWLIPRIYAHDLKSAIFRCAPVGGGRFLAGTRTKLEEVLARFKGSNLKLTLYSHELNLTEPAARSRINVVFGVQNANVEILSRDGLLKKVDKLQEIAKEAREIEGDTPEIRSLVGQYSFYEYAKAVANGNPQSNLTLLPHELEPLEGLAKTCGFPPLLDPKGQNGVLWVTTSAEGQDNLDLCYRVAANIRTPYGIVLHVRR